MKAGIANVGGCKRRGWHILEGCVLAGIANVRGLQDGWVANIRWLCDDWDCYCWEGCKRAGLALRGCL